MKTLAVDFAFQNAPGVLLDLAALMVVVAEIRPL